ncbi:MAG: peptidylprolyl isomerase [Balneola sp.]
MTKQVRALSLCFLLTVFFTFPSYSQSKIDGVVVGTVGDQKITYGELKNNLNSDPNKQSSLKELEEFLPIYLEYKAKIKFAQDNGIFDSPKLVKELEIYAKQASYSYWINNRIKEAEFDYYYKRASTEVKSEHILISVPPNASPSDTLAAYKRLIEARNKFLNGTDLAELDPQYSSKQNGRSMGGDLSWFSIGTTIKEFEDVVYNLEKGEISMPFRTQFGYHIVHLQDKRPRTPSRYVSHIFTALGTKESKAKIEQAYNELKKDSLWSKTVLKYSDDNLSASNSGRLGWINHGKFRTDFTDSVMAIDPNLEYTRPIQTSYGYHIFRIDSVQTFKSEKERKESYMKEFLESSNFSKSNEYVINWIQKNVNDQIFKESITDLESFFHSKNTSLLKDISYSENEATIYKIKDFHFTKNEYIEYLTLTYPNIKATDYSNTWMSKFISQSIDSVIVELTTSEFPEFKDVIDNYKKGLAVYQVNDDYLWNASTVDTTELKQIYNNNPQNYIYQKRYHYYLLSALADSTLEKAVDFIRTGNSPDSIRSYFPRVAVSSDSVALSSDPPFDKLRDMKPNSFSLEFDHRNRKALFYLESILPSRKMTFNESFNRILSEYQPIREKEWLDDLKKTYKIKSDVNKLRSTFKKEKALK